MQVRGTSPLVVILQGIGVSDWYETDQISPHCLPLTQMEAAADTEEKTVWSPYPFDVRMMWTRSFPLVCFVSFALYDGTAIYSPPRNISLCTVQILWTCVLSTGPLQVRGVKRDRYDLSQMNTRLAEIVDQ